MNLHVAGPAACEAGMTHPEIHQQCLEAAVTTAHAIIAVEALGLCGAGPAACEA